MIYWKHLISILIHKWFVFKAGLIVGGIPLWRLIAHDWSKFTPIEFVNYAKYWQGKYQAIDRWAEAWLHHLHHNPHHPEYWVLSWRGDPDYYDGLGESLAEFVTVLSMPETYVREMIADWMGASKVFTGSDDIANWLNANGPKMKLHSETKGLIYVVMSELGYTSDLSPWSYRKD